jgi:hypothetical protein
MEGRGTGRTVPGSGVRPALQEQPDDLRLPAVCRVDEGCCALHPTIAGSGRVDMSAQIEEPRGDVGRSMLSRLEQRPGQLFLRVGSREELFHLRGTSQGDGGQQVDGRPELQEQVP